MSSTSNVDSRSLPDTMSSRARELTRRSNFWNVQRVQNRLVVLVDQHHDALSGMPVKHHQQIAESFRGRGVLGLHAGLALDGIEPRHDVGVQASRLPEVVEDLAVVVRQHCQEPVERRRAELGAELRQVALDERADERLPPRRAVGVGSGQERSREPAPDPEARHPRRADLGDLQAAQLDVLDAAGQRLGALPQQVGAGAAEHEKPGRVVVAVSQHPQDRPESGRAPA